MENDNKVRFRAEKHDRFWTGLVLLIVGGFLLLDKMGADLPHWLFSWPMLLILFGVVTGLKHRFENLSWLIMVAVGGVFLADEMDRSMHLQEYLWPAVIMAFGLLFVLRPKKKWRRERPWEMNDMGRDLTGFGSTTGPGFEKTAFQPAATAEDRIESISIFGAVKRVITSKNFLGGEVICFMGGAEYNLTQADIPGPITIEVIQVFGGAKFFVPPHWEVRSESVTIFGGFEDKRVMQPGAFDPSKLIIIKGTTIFGGVEIRSF